MHVSLSIWMSFAHTWGQGLCTHTSVPSPSRIHARHFVFLNVNNCCLRLHAICAHICVFIPSINTHQSVCLNICGIFVDVIGTYTLVLNYTWLTNYTRTLLQKCLHLVRDPCTIRDPCVLASVRFVRVHSIVYHASNDACVRHVCVRVTLALTWALYCYSSDAITWLPRPTRCFDS